MTLQRINVLLGTFRSLTDILLNILITILMNEDDIDVT